VTQVVDVHSHLYPRAYLERLKQRTEIPRLVGSNGDERFVIFPEEIGAAGGRPMGPEYWDVDAKLDAMKRHGIDRAVWSLGNPWLDPILARESVELARSLNEEFEGLARRTGNRVLGLGVLPNDDVAAAVREIHWIAGRPGLRGVISGSRPCGLAPDDAELEPVWEALEGSGLVFFLHPHYAVGLSELTGYGHTLPVALGFPFETTVALARMALSGVLERHPNIRILAAHGGGTLPFLSARLDAGWRSSDRSRVALDRPPSEVLRSIYVDAVVYHSRALAATIDFVGTDHVLFGTDQPFSISDPSANREAISVGQVDAKRILSGNAMRLFELGS
jgi:aminocarboxymuconate-semialdehyde decarboxylase